VLLKDERFGAIVLEAIAESVRIRKTITGFGNLSGLAGNDWIDETPKMNALGVYACLTAATVISVLVSLSADLRIRLIRTPMVILSYVLLVVLFFLDPWWRVLAIWGFAGLATGLFCFAVDRFWTRQGHGLQPELPQSSNAWLIPLGLLGWPDMLPQAVEFSQFDHRVVCTSSNTAIPSGSPILRHTAGQRGYHVSN
jgi:hypothetical protein